MPPPRRLQAVPRRPRPAPPREPCDTTAACPAVGDQVGCRGGRWAPRWPSGCSGPPRWRWPGRRRSAPCACASPRPPTRTRQRAALGVRRCAPHRVRVAGHEPRRGGRQRRGIRRLRLRPGHERRRARVRRPERRGRRRALRAPGPERGRHPRRVHVPRGEPRLRRSQRGLRRVRARPRHRPRSRQRVSEGDEADGSSSEPDISADGRYVVFTSNAGNLVEGDANGQADVFVRDLLTGVTVLVSVSRRDRATDRSADGESSAPRSARTAAM